MPAKKPAKGRSDRKKPVSDVASRRYKTSSDTMYGGGNVSFLYDRLTGESGGRGRTGKWEKPRSEKWSYYMDKKTATNVKQRTRKSVSPKRKSK